MSADVWFGRGTLDLSFQSLQCLLLSNMIAVPNGPPDMKVHYLWHVSSTQVVSRQNKGSYMAIVTLLRYSASVFGSLSCICTCFIGNEHIANEAEFAYRR